MNLGFGNFVSQFGHNPILCVITVLICGVVLVNGWTDAPNAIATCVATRSLSPKKALVMAAVLNFLGVLVMTFLSTTVAETIYKIVDFGGNTQNALIALCAALVAIVVWSLFAWIFGIPTSQSHALIASLSGAAISIQHGISGINFEQWKKVLYGLAISTVFGFILGFLINRLIEKICNNVDRRKTVPFFKKTQVIGDAVMTFMHGAQDGQKFLAIFIMGAFLANGVARAENFSIPIWMMIGCSAIMTLGTCIGGSKIIKNVGMNMAKIEPYQGTSADLAGSVCLIFSSFTGIPVSTSQTKTTAIMGVGASKGRSNVDWNIAKNMVIAWIVTFPGCGLLGYLLTTVLIKIFG